MPILKPAQRHKTKKQHKYTKKITRQSKQKRCDMKKATQKKQNGKSLNPGKKKKGSVDTE